MQTKEYILTGNLWKLMFKMSLPGILGMLVISTNSFVDAIFVGRMVGPNALAGVSMAMPLLIINTAAIALISAGAASMLSRAIGKGDTHIPQHILKYVSWYSIGISFILGVIGYNFAKPLLALMGANDAVLLQGSAYYKIIMAGCVTSIFGLSTSSLIRAEGHVKQAMRITATAVLLNIVLNPILIGKVGLGIQGSAYATVISMGIYSVLNIHYFLSGKSILRFNLFNTSIDANILSGIFGVGLSAMTMQASSFVRQVLLFKTVAWYSDASQIAFFSASYRIFAFSIIPVFGLLQALQPISGMSFGAGNLERSIESVKVFRKASIALMLIIMLPSFLFPQTVLSLLLPNVQFTATDIFHFRLILTVLPLAPIASTSIVFLQSIGHAKLSMYLSLGRELFLFVPLILFFPLIEGASGIYYSILCENLIYMTIVFFVIKKHMGTMVAAKA